MRDGQSRKLKLGMRPARRRFFLSFLDAAPKPRLFPAASVSNGQNPCQFLDNRVNY
jgi:hypothetical protein